MAAAQQRDNEEIEAHRATRRNTRAGVAVVTGQGAWPPPQTAPQLQEPTLIIGTGSSHSLTGVATTILFTGSDAMDRYARTTLNGGRATNSAVGKPDARRSPTQKFTGQNRGVTDSSTTGICAISYVNNIISAHSIHLHANEQNKERAMRQDLLANLSDSVRPQVTTYDGEGPWIGLVTHFLTTLGPPDIKLECAPC